MSQTTNLSTAPSEMRTLKTLIHYLWPKENFRLQLSVFAAVFFLLSSKCFNVFVPIFYKKAVDSLSLDMTRLELLPILLICAYGATRVVAQVSNELKDLLFARVEEHAVRDIALNAFRHLHRLGLRFHLDRKTGGVTQSLDRGLKGIETVLRFLGWNILPTFLEIVLVCGVLWYFYNALYSLTTLTTLAAYIAYTLYITQWRITAVRAMNNADNDAKTKSMDSLINFETVKYFGNEQHEERRFDVALALYEKAAIQTKKGLSILNIGQGIIIALGLTSVMLMAGADVMTGEMTLGDFVLVNAYLMQLYIPLGILGFAYREIKMALVNMENMFSLLDVDAEIVDHSNASELQVHAGEIIFDKVGFGYTPDRQILHDVSFKVPAGKTVAIVGTSGAGKSTISRLLFRFYEATSGTISIDGKDIQSVTQQSLRNAIGIVPQDTVLFNDTIFYNIAYGRPGASEEEVHAAAKLARIHDFIQELPSGYDAIVGERGLKLSGGEKQRVAIARTLLKAPAIFLFDEATSALDTHTEKAIQASLREVSANHTTLTIAHRLSTVIDADEIIVLERGEVVERGRHQELLKAGKVYAAMWHRQQKSAHESSSENSSETSAED